MRLVRLTGAEEVEEDAIAWLLRMIERAELLSSETMSCEARSVDWILQL
jgi:hypothetical protein